MSSPSTSGLVSIVVRRSPDLRPTVVSLSTGMPIVVPPTLPCDRSYAARCEPCHHLEEEILRLGHEPIV